MIGSIIGDISGSAYEFNPVFTDDFDLITKNSEFTDDTVLTVAVAECLLDKSKNYSHMIKSYARIYKGRGYGGNFAKWIKSDKHEPYGSYGNGSAMRVSFIGLLFDDIEEAKKEAKKSAECTHNHLEGIKGAEATVMAIILAKQGKSKEEIKTIISDYTGYDLSRSYLEVKRTHRFNEICQQTVPEALISFFESNSYEDCIKKCIALRGDADTLACIAGGIAEAYYKEIPKYLFDFMNKELPEEFNEKIVECYKKAGIDIKSIIV